ncbi:MAG: hypothetical protein CFE21_00755 [Bacteroidetes bacterium B1(2017)]|nr:MAG: hypothetical protein CFE21_00755 [Bacteroidetes bacterium B1(2017)]
MINITAVILTLKEDVKLEELADVLKHEQEVIAQWKQAGYIHDMYLREGRKGAVILFNELTELKVTDLVESLPLMPYFKPAEYLNLLK